jgi:hypothetical protein
MIRCLASLPRVPRVGSPASAVLSRHYDFLPPVPSRFVAFAWRYHGCTVRFAPPGRTCSPEGLDLFARCLRPGIAVETTGSPKFLGNPDCPFAHVLRPRQDCSFQTACGTAAWPPLCKRRRLPRLITLSRLSSMAFGLAVYASSSRSPIHDARLASGRWSDATGRAFHPQGSAERFQRCFLHLILLSQAFLAQLQNVKKRYIGGPWSAAGSVAAFSFCGRRLLEKLGHGRWSWFAVRPASCGFKSTLRELAVGLRGLLYT